MKENQISVLKVNNNSFVIREEKKEPRVLDLAWLVSLLHSVDTSPSIFDSRIEEILSMDKLEYYIIDSTR